MLEALRAWQQTNTETSEFTTTPLVGEVVDVSESGSLMVKVEGKKPVKARAVAEIAAEPRFGITGAEVALLFEGGDPQRPIAIARMNSNCTKDLNRAAHDENEVLEAVLDGQKVLIEAKEKIELRCGKGSIVIHSNGRITIRGTHLLSRSSGPVRIKGGHVDIN